jgi:hypothetical protein
MRPPRCWSGWRPGPGSARPIQRWGRSPGCAGGCRWRSGWWPASCITTRPGRRPGGRAVELAAAVDRLELMATENVSVAAAFNLSYADLTAEQQRLFRRLGLHQGTDIDGYAAAALDGTGLAAARRGLEALYDQYLLAESAQGRYRMHDLIRARARALAERNDPHRDRDQATARLLDYYQHAATLSDAFLARQVRTTSVPAAGTIPAAVPVLVGREQALAWARAERANLIGCLDHATGTGQHARVIGLTAGMAGLLRLDGPWAEALTRHAAAVRPARHLGDRPGRVGALTPWGTCGGWPGTIRARCGTWRRRWASPGTSATGSARPTPSPNWGSCGG